MPRELVELEPGAAGGKRAEVRDSVQQMNSPTEPIGSIPRPRELLDALARNDAGDPGLGAHCDTAFAAERLG